MLTISRRHGQRIMIGPGVIEPGKPIILTALSGGGEGLRIGIEAPREIPVDREEVYMQVRRYFKCRICCGESFLTRSERDKHEHTKENQS